MDEEFRLLTLQVIGEAILGLPYQQCDEVCLHPSKREPSRECMVDVSYFWPGGLVYGSEEAMAIVKVFGSVIGNAWSRTFDSF